MKQTGHVNWDQRKFASNPTSRHKVSAGCPAISETPVQGGLYTPRRAKLHESLPYLAAKAAACARGVDIPYAIHVGFPPPFSGENCKQPLVSVGRISNAIERPGCVVWSHATVAKFEGRAPCGCQGEMGRISLEEELASPRAGHVTTTLSYIWTALFPSRARLKLFFFSVSLWKNDRAMCVVWCVVGATLVVYL